MSAFLRFIPAIVVALAGAGLELGGYENPLLGDILLISAAVLAVIGAASLWIQQYIELRTARAPLQGASEEVSQELARLHDRIERLTAERDALREEKRRNLQHQRRKRIEEWRSVVRNFDFNTLDRFPGTDTYSQIRPYLQPEVVKMLETPRTVYVGNEARGGSVLRYTLLDEIARIEKEWDLV